LPALAGRSPLLRLQTDEKLVALIRRGHHGAFEALMQRYQPRLLAFCRHMLSSREDAEDVLQEVFAAAFNAICADDRPINARPWLYRIARNRCLNHLRRAQAVGQDSMDVYERDAGASTADTVHSREEFRQIVADVGELPETQRTALLLREIDALSYEQIAETMETTVPSVKSLLVRARVSLAEAAESRLLTCDEVRLELGGVAEGITRTSPPIRRHLRTCERCRTFRAELKKSTKALAAVYPIAPFIFLKKLSLAKLGFGGAAGAAASSGGGAAAGGAAGGVAGAAAGAAGGITAGGAVSAGVSTLATKAAAGMAAAVIVTAGAVEVKHVGDRQVAPAAPAAVAEAPAAPAARPAPAQAAKAEPRVPVAKARRTMTAEPAPAEPEVPAAAPATTPATPPAETAPAETAPAQEDGSVVTLPGSDDDVLTEPADQADPAAPPAAPADPGAATPAEPPASAPPLPPAPVQPAGATAPVPSPPDADVPVGGRVY
jgi:RNA polymerase sigma factor (sigma-70 family)